MTNEGNAGDAHQKKKRIAIVSVSSLILVAMVVAVAVGVNHGNHASGGESGDSAEGSSGVQSSQKSVQAICQPTDYKQACVTSLAGAGNTTNPRDLIKAAFNSTMQQINEAVQNSTVLEEIEKDPRGKQALQNCKELMEYAIHDLQTSFDQLGDIDVTKVDDIIKDLKIWLSAAITYEETCLDGFQNTTGDAGQKMRTALNASMELTSNGLAIVSEISTILTQFNIPVSRRLLSEEEELASTDEEGYPAWVSAGKRKLLQTAPANIKADAIVAQDGSGKFKTITEALATVPPKSNVTFVIYVKEGIYKEQVEIGRTTTHVMMIGDGPTKTRVSGNKNFIDGTPTFKTATFAVIGDGFICKDMGFENTAGAAKHQAVALRVQSDMSVFFNCAMDAYQDTLYTHTKRQFYRDCTISGTIDFIFGDAAVVFQNCKMLVRQPMANQQCIVTAQGRKDVRQPTGTVLQDCTISADPTFVDTTKAYLGRPWKEFSRTIIMTTQIDDLIQPDGWLPWMGDFALNTCFYTEYMNRGPGANTARRVRWPGIKTITAQEVADFTPSTFIQGDMWIKPTNVPYTSGMSKNVM